MSAGRERNGLIWLRSVVDAARRHRLEKTLSHLAGADGGEKQIEYSITYRNVAYILGRCVRMAAGSDACEPSLPYACGVGEARPRRTGGWRSCGSILDPLFVHVAPWRNSVRSAHVYRRRVFVDAGALAAGFFPARRATRVDPIRSLHYE